MKIVILAGTRPEAIKMIPLVKALKETAIQSKFCVISQHEKMLDQVLKIFDIQPDFYLKIPNHQANLSELTANLLLTLSEFFTKEKPDRIIVQGDTSTSFVGSLAAYYLKIPVAHVEAGLRSFHIYSPWPEEMNRKLITQIADMHFAPTFHARENLLKESIEKENIYVTGNTGIDGLNLSLEYLNNNKALMESMKKTFSWLDKNKKMILVTAHRRENHGKNLEIICEALKCLAARDDVQIACLLHLNPNVYSAIQKLLKDTPNIYLLEPQDYLSCIYLIQESYFIMSDSGGLQEEAPSLGKPVLVLRECTERNEGILLGIAKLVRLNVDAIVKSAENLLQNSSEYLKMCPKFNPYGDGQAARRIANIILEDLEVKTIKEHNKYQEITRLSLHDENA